MWWQDLVGWAHPYILQWTQTPCLPQQGHPGPAVREHLVAALSAVQQLLTQCDCASNPNGRIDFDNRRASSTHQRPLTEAASKPEEETATQKRAIADPLAYVRWTKMLRLHRNSNKNTAATPQLAFFEPNPLGFCCRTRRNHLEPIATYPCAPTCHTPSLAWCMPDAWSSASSFLAAAPSLHYPAWPHNAHSCLVWMTIQWHVCCYSWLK